MPTVTLSLLRLVSPHKPRARINHEKKNLSYLMDKRMRPSITGNTGSYFLALDLHNCTGLWRSGTQSCKLLVLLMV